MAREGYASGPEADRIKGAARAMGQALGSNKEPIYVMRHGMTALDAMKRSDGWLDFPLTDEGRQGIIPAQQYLKEKPLTTIYAPDLKRNMETAEIIQSGMGVNPPDIDVTDAIKTWNLGKKLVGSKKYPNRPIVKRYMANPEKTPDGGESMDTFRKRFLGWFEKLTKEKRAGPVLLVLSGSCIRELSQLIAGNRDEHDLDEGGLMELTRTGNSWTCHGILGTKHGSGEEPSSYGS